MKEILSDKENTCNAEQWRTHNAVNLYFEKKNTHQTTNR